MSKPSPTLPELAALPELRRHGERAKLLWVNYLNELGLQQRAAHERARAIHMYHVLPAMFGDCYPASEAVVDAVALAGLAYSTQLIIEDRQADGDDAPWPDLLKEGAVLRADLPALLGRTPSHRTGTKAVAVLQQEYQHAVECEQAWSKEQAQITWDAYLRVGADKAALLKAPVFFLADSCGKPVNEGLLRGLDAFSAALQIRDDLTDWRDDWGAGRRAHLELWIGSPIVSAEEVGHALFIDGLSDMVVRRAHEQATIAKNAFAAADAGYWSASAEALGTSLVRLRSAIRTTRRRVVATSQRTIDRRVLGRMARTAGRALTAELAAGLPESTHRMRFRHADGFGGVTEDHAGSVFAAATILWALGTAAEGSTHERTKACGALMAQRPNWGSVGWSYFPTLPDLPTDRDDLAQVALAVRAIGGELSHLATTQRELLNAIRPDGIVTPPLDTWMVAASCDPAVRARQEEAIRRWWGRGTDAEVLANFCYALVSCGITGDDVQAYVASGLDVIKRAQESDGSWSSTWYVGPFYGTFVAVRLLAHVDEAPDRVARARSFVKATQRADGGWGAARSSAQDTALAVLSLIGDETAITAVRRGIEFLVLTQRRDGTWRGAPFIRMNLYGAVPYRQARYLTYRSDLMATAYALLAIKAVWSTL